MGCEIEDTLNEHACGRTIQYEATLVRNSDDEDGRAPGGGTLAGNYLDHRFFQTRAQHDTCLPRSHGEDLSGRWMYETGIGEDNRVSFGKLY